MMKYLKYTLICVPCVLTILLGVNIYKYFSYQNNNEIIIENTNNYSKQINEYNNKKEELNQELTTLKEENKDKIWEYERWVKWNQEMLEKIK